MPDATAPPPGPPAFTLSITVEAPVARLSQAFFSHTDLGYWWEAERSVTVARSTGVYAVTWPPSEVRDEVLGRLGGTLHGTVMDYFPNRSLFIADVYWQPPDSEPLGPMALEVTWESAGEARSTVTVRQSASEDGPRWQRYFALTKDGWTVALGTLKDYLENEWLYRVRTIKQARP
ncbi:MAG: hypothetical protein R2708_01355 [Vicinamibacterales bacterium]